MKLKKSSLLQLLPHFSLSTMYEVVGEAILPNTFFQNSSASSRKSLMKLFSKKIALLVKLSCAKQTRRCMYVYTLHLWFFDHLQNGEPTKLGIIGVTIDASLLTNTPHITKKTTSLNPKIINIEKYKHCLTNTIKKYLNPTIIDREKYEHLVRNLNSSDHEICNQLRSVHMVLYMSIFQRLSQADLKNDEVTTNV